MFSLTYHIYDSGPETGWIDEEMGKFYYREIFKGPDSDIVMKE
jgi:hypothetical protein